MNKQYIYIKYEDELEPRTFAGKAYSYSTYLDLKVGDIVEAPTKFGNKIAIVSEINVAEERIKDVIPYIKNITIKFDKTRFLDFAETIEVAA